MIRRREHVGHAKSLAYVLKELGRILIPLVKASHFGSLYTSTKSSTNAFTIVLFEVIVRGIVFASLKNRSAITNKNRLPSLVVANWQRLWMLQTLAALLPESFACLCYSVEGLCCSRHSWHIFVKLHSNPLKCLPRKYFCARTSKGIVHPGVPQMWWDGSRAVRVQREPVVLPRAQNSRQSEARCYCRLAQWKLSLSFQCITYRATEVAIFLRQEYLVESNRNEWWRGIGR